MHTSYESYSLVVVLEYVRGESYVRYAYYELVWYYATRVGVVLDSSY